MESLPLILQSASALLGFALSRYLWEVNRSVSSVAVGFSCFVSTFYPFIVTVSAASIDCPFRTPFSLSFALWSAPPPLTLELRPTDTLPQSATQQPRAGLPPEVAVGEENEPGADTTTHDSIALAEIKPSALFAQEKDTEGDTLDAGFHPGDYLAQWNQEHPAQAHL